VDKHLQKKMVVFEMRNAARPVVSEAYSLLASRVRMSDFDAQTTVVTIDGDFRMYRLRNVHPDPAAERGRALARFSDMDFSNERSS
jgi:hypothetical protein